jgi:hypothetical protein
VQKNFGQSFDLLKKSWKPGMVGTDKKDTVLPGEGRIWQTVKQHRHDRQKNHKS